MAAKVNQVVEEGMSREALWDVGVKLKADASVYHQQIVVGGREQLLALIGRTYAQFVLINAQHPQLIGKMKGECERAGIKFRKTSTEASIIIRWTFADFDDKQVSVYGGAIHYGRQIGITPEGFTSWVQTNGGFEGIRKLYAKPPKAANDPVFDLEFAIDNLPAPNHAIVEADNEDWFSEPWAAGEQVRIYAGVPTDDEKVALKDLCLSRERCEAVMEIYLAEFKERRDSKLESMLTPDERKEVKRLELNVKAEDGNIEIVQEEMEKYGTPERLPTLQADLQNYLLRRYEFESRLGKFKAMAPRYAAKALQINGRKPKLLRNVTEAQVNVAFSEMTKPTIRKV